MQAHLLDAEFFVSTTLRSWNIIGTVYNKQWKNFTTRTLLVDRYRWHFVFLHSEEENFNLFDYNKSKNTVQAEKLRAG